MYAYILPTSLPGEDAAIQAQDVRSPFVEPFGEDLWRCSLQAVSVVFNRDLYDERFVRDVAHASHRGVYFIQVEKCFENHYINAAVD